MGQDISGSGPPFAASIPLLQKPLSRRLFLGAGLAAGTGVVAGTSTPIAAAEAVPVRLGVLQFGTAQWVADVVRQHGLDRASGFALQPSTLANTDAGRIALMAGAVDVAVLDWVFVAAQRQAGTRLCFAPFSSSVGGIMVPDASPVRSLTDLAHRRLGVAGGPVDKSWLLVQAAARQAGGDLATAAEVVYGAPPLLNAKLRQGDLDAVLTYWNFAARLEAEGCRQVISVDDCASRLGLPADMSMIGFVFHQDWANQNAAAVNGFLQAVTTAQEILAHSDAEWQRIRPLVNAPDDALFQRLRQRFIAGIGHPPAQKQEQAAKQMLAVLLRTGGPRATDGLKQLPDGVFWDTPNVHG